MPSHLLKSSPVDTSPPVVILPPNIVELDVEGAMEQVDVHYQFPVVYQEEDPKVEKATDTEAASSTQSISVEQTPVSDVTPGKGGKRGNKLLKRSIKKLDKLDPSKNGESTKTSTSRKSLKQFYQELKKLPEAVYKTIDDYTLDDAPPRPNNAYIRYIERTPEELAEIIEYDLDEEDFAWLEIINEKRAKEGLQAVQPEVVEFIMDKLEKESYFQMQSSGMEQGPIIDDDAVCCICMDGECQNANAILFCDMCNLAVHQECYGVPYIPEGQWLCRRCLLSPSIAVDCVLCPNKGGAFKETECKKWAHVVCAIWIPEVCFSNTVFLEPIDNVGSIPQARWRLQCFICKQKNVGACIQCYKSNCYTAFHVTCAQQAGLCMRMETVRLSTGVTVKKTAWCDLHAPPDFIAERDSGSSTARQKLKQIRKMLAEKRCAPPVLSIPTIPSDQMTQISNAVSFTRKKEFIRLLSSYWKLKRMSRNGVPLLRRLQVASNTNSVKSSRKIDASQAESTMQNYAEIMRLRQDLERGRLLCELTRKREKLKREQIYTKCQEWDMRIQPFNYFLSSIVEDLCSKDSQSIFTQPVDIEQVPDYLTVVTNPMDLSTMRAKIFDFAYQRIEDLEVDFKQMINNCLLYNSPETVFYRFAMKMLEYGGIVFREAKRKYEVIGFEGDSGIMELNPPPQYLTQPHIVDDAKLTAEIDSFLNDESRFNLSFEDHMNILEQTLDKSVNLNHPVSRKKRFIRIKNEILRLKRKKRMREEGLGGVGGGDASSLDEDEVAPSPSVFGGSSDAGEEGEGASTTYPSSTYISVLRRRLRSTDMNVDQQNEPLTCQSHRISRRLSRSSECTTLTPPTSSHVPPDPRLISGANTSIYSVLPGPGPFGEARRRGRPPKALSQRGRGHHLKVSSRGSSSPLRQHAFPGPSKRGGGIHGRPGRPKGRRMARPVRRSDRVVKQQMLAQQQHSSSQEKEGQLEPQRELRRGSPQARNSSPKSLNQRGSGSRNASPTSNQKIQVSGNVSILLGSPAKSLQRSEMSRQRSPILGSNLNPHQVRGGGVRRVSSRPASPSGATPMRKLIANRQVNTSPPSPPKSRPRPVRERAVKMMQQNSTGNLPNLTSYPKSMEAAAKSIICEDKSPRRQVLSGANALSTSASGKLKKIRGASPNIPTRGAITNQVVRRNSLLGKSSSVAFENLNHSSIIVASTAESVVTPKKVKGPAGAVGRRKKSTTETNGPPMPCVENNTEETDKRKLLFPPTNGLPLVPSSASPTKQVITSMTSSKKRPRRNAATAAGSHIQNQNPVEGYHNNVLTGVSSSLYNSSPGLHLKKMDSFSVYRSGGDHEINSYSEAESGNEDDDEVEEEEDDDDDDEEEDDDEEDEDEEEEDAGKSVSASDDEEEDDDEDAEQKTKKPSGGKEDEEEESEDGNTSDEREGQGEDSSDSDNSSDSDSDSSSTSSSSMSSTNSGSSTASSSSSITTPKHMHPTKGRKFRRRRSSSMYRQPPTQTLSVASAPVNSTPMLSLYREVGNRTGTPQQMASPTLANNNNNNVLCSNKEIEKDRDQTVGNEQRSGDGQGERSCGSGVDASGTNKTPTNGSSSTIHQ